MLRPYGKGPWDVDKITHVTNSNLLLHMSFIFITHYTILKIFQNDNIILYRLTYVFLSVRQSVYLDVLSKVQITK